MKRLVLIALTLSLVIIAGCGGGGGGNNNEVTPPTQATVLDRLVAGENYSYSVSVASSDIVQSRALSSEIGASYKTDRFNNRYYPLTWLSRTGSLGMLYISQDSTRSLYCHGDRFSSDRLVTNLNGKYLMLRCPIVKGDKWKQTVSYSDGTTETRETTVIGEDSGVWEVRTVVTSGNLTATYTNYYSPWECAIPVKFISQTSTHTVTMMML
jgi:hypothetical protein